MNDRIRRLLLKEWRGAVISENTPLPSANLKEVFDRALKGLGISERFRELSLQEAWRELVGPTLSPHCRPRGVRGGVLSVMVDHPAWLHQITLVHRKDILHSVQQKFPHLKIKDLRLKIG